MTGASLKGRKKSLVTRMRMAEAKKGRVVSDETRAKLAAAQVAVHARKKAEGRDRQRRWIDTIDDEPVVRPPRPKVLEITRFRLSQGTRRQPREFVERISELRRGQKRTPEQRARMSAAKMGHPTDMWTRWKIRRVMLHKSRNRVLTWGRIADQIISMQAAGMIARHDSALFVGMERPNVPDQLERCPPWSGVRKAKNKGV